MYNEKGNVNRLLGELRDVLGKCEYEIIIVDDGSYDGTFEELKKAASDWSILKVVRFNRNFGQTSAFAVGIKVSQGDTIVTMDGDLENDPHDIPHLLRLLDDGYDLVSGWRKNRWHGKWFTRKLPSLVANSIISAISGVRLHDYGCTLKAYRRSIIADVSLYGEMHRFIPAYVKRNGARIIETEVNHRPRTYGKSKYGLGRTFRVILDMLFLVYMTRYMNTPIHFFGGLGFSTLTLGFLAGIISIVLKVMGIRSFVETPLPVISTLFIIVGIQLIVIGILAEIIMRTYYESQQRTPYKIRETVNLYLPTK